jgi:hypothetical protein
MNKHLSHGGGFQMPIEDEEIFAHLKEWLRKQKRKKEGVTVKLFLKHIQTYPEMSHIKQESTARKYLSRLGFYYSAATLGLYFDGHERPDVVAYRKKLCEFIEEEMKLGSIFIFQDESIYHAKERRNMGWHEKGSSFRRKGDGKGLMISCWMDQFGPIAFTEEEWTRFKKINPSIPQSAIFSLNFGKEWGYYDYEKFERDTKTAISIAKTKYEGKRIVFLFDHSSVHKKKAKNSLNAKNMNLKPGGKQNIFHDTIYQNQKQTFTFPQNHPTFPGLAKGAAQIAKERGFSIEKKKRDEVVAMLARCHDFLKEKSMLEKLCEENEIIAKFFPKFHCEFNMCELVWANSKRYCSVNCGDNLPTLEKNIPLSFKAIPLTTYFKTYQHVMEEIKVASSQTKKNDMKVYKSHRPPVGSVPFSHLLLDFQTLSPPPEKHQKTERYFADKQII